VILHQRRREFSAHQVALEKRVSAWIPAPSENQYARGGKSESLTSLCSMYREHPNEAELHCESRPPTINQHPGADQGPEGTVTRVLRHPVCGGGLRVGRSKSKKKAGVRAGKSTAGPSQHRRRARTARRDAIIRDTALVQGAKSGAPPDGAMMSSATASAASPAIEGDV